MYGFSIPVGLVVHTALEAGSNCRIHAHSSLLHLTVSLIRPNTVKASSLDLHFLKPAKVFLPNSWIRVTAGLTKPLTMKKQKIWPNSSLRILTSMLQQPTRRSSRQHQKLKLLHKNISL